LVALARTWQVIRGESNVADHSADLREVSDSASGARHCERLLGVLTRAGEIAFIQSKRSDAIEFIRNAKRIAKFNLFLRLLIFAFCFMELAALHGNVGKVSEGDASIHRIPAFRPRLHSLLKQFFGLLDLSLIFVADGHVVQDNTSFFMLP
jgi:hypothetical protein